MSKMRNHSMRLVALGILIITGGCATRAQLDRGLEEQRAALAAERAERIAADEQLGRNVVRVAGDVEALTSELAALDREFGAKLTQLEEGLQLTVPVHFGFDRADVRDEALQVLDRFARLVQIHYPEAMITVEGFTDPAGSAAYNRRLAQKRAEVVREELIQRGLLSTQLRAVGYGSDRPVVPGAAGGAFGAELNRRVVFVIENASPGVLGIPTTAAR